MGVGTASRCEPARSRGPARAVGGPSLRRLGKTRESYFAPRGTRAIRASRWRPTRPRALRSLSMRRFRGQHGSRQSAQRGLDGSRLRVPAACRAHSPSPHVPNALHPAHDRADLRAVPPAAAARTRGRSSGCTTRCSSPAIRPTRASRSRRGARCSRTRSRSRARARYVAFLPDRFQFREELSSLTHDGFATRVREIATQVSDAARHPGLHRAAGHDPHARQPAHFKDSRAYLKQGMFGFDDETAGLRARAAALRHPPGVPARGRARRAPSRCASSRSTTIRARLYIENQASFGP